MQLYTPPSVATEVPLVDLSANPTAAAEAIHRACRDTGFFYIAHHGVPQALIDAQFDAARRLFDLPLAAKMAIHMKNSPAGEGYEPMGGQILDSQDATAEKAPPDLKESFYCGLELADEDPLARRNFRCFGHNQWPDLPGFRAQCLAYYGAMTGLASRLCALLALSLDMPTNWFDPFMNPATANLRLLHYPPHPSTADTNQIGAGAHTDWGGVTILAQDEVGGLEVQTTAGTWIEAPPLPGTFVINLGDLMARWTNGIYMSNMHRVKNNRSGRDRYSIPFFNGPFPTARIEPIPSCVDATNPPRFAVCTAQEHTLEMFRRSYGYSLQPT